MPSGGADSTFVRPWEGIEESNKHRRLNTFSVYTFSSPWGLPFWPSKNDFTSSGLNRTELKTFVAVNKPLLRKRSTDRVLTFKT
jgi:hypothetical protein